MSFAAKFTMLSLPVCLRAASILPAPLRLSKGLLERIKRVFPPDATTRTPNEIQQNLNQCRLLFRLWQIHGGEWTPDSGHLFDYELSEQFIQAQEQHKPIMLMLWHGGILPSTFAALAKFSANLLLIKSVEIYQEHSRLLNTLATDGFEDSPALHHAREIKTALKHLKQGGILATFVDGTHGKSGITVNFFGNPISLKAGTSIIARRSGAMVFPCISRWNVETQRLTFLVGDAITYPNSGSSWKDETFLQQSVNWFENHFKQHPHDITSQTLHLLRSTPDSVNSHTVKQES